MSCGTQLYDHRQTIRVAHPCQVVMPACMRAQLHVPSTLACRSLGWPTALLNMCTQKFACHKPGGRSFLCRVLVFNSHGNGWAKQVIWNTSGNSRSVNYPSLHSVVQRFLHFALPLHAPDLVNLHLGTFYRWFPGIEYMPKCPAVTGEWMLPADMSVRGGQCSILYAFQTFLGVSMA